MPDCIAAVVLAAGSSRRFGADKLLHPVTRCGHVMPLLALSLLPWLDVFEKVCVVVRKGETIDAIKAALGEEKSARLFRVVCVDAAQGMAASLACGVRANVDVAGWLIGLADMPLVPSCAIAGVRDALLVGAPLAAPSRNGRLGHPVGFSSRYLEELIDLQGDRGARHILERDEVSMVDVEDDGIFSDIDLPSDLLKL